jgi:hypothetical protein
MFNPHFSQIANAVIPDAAVQQPDFDVLNYAISWTTDSLKTTNLPFHPCLPIISSIKSQLIIFINCD